MGINRFVVNIEGDYVDSYIYSGLLLLVDMNYRVNVFKWESLFSKGFDGVNFFQATLLKNLLLDSRNEIPRFAVSEVTITKSMLNSAKLYSHDIGVWPSDINVYANKLYISSERGVSILDVNYKTGELGGELKIFDEMCFAISPNSFGRLAFAAGKEGVFTLSPLSSKFIGRSDVKQLITETCVDLDWQSTLLFATTDKGVVEAAYSKMPEKKDFSNEADFFSAIKESKQRKPDVSIYQDVQSSWIGGDKKYSFLKAGQIMIERFSSNNSRTLIDLCFNEKVLRARTAAFGTAIETDQQLYALIGSDKFDLAREPIGWRVFPRAKNYANQLHVIQDDRIEITIVESIQNNDFGFDTESIDLKG